MKKGDEVVTKPSIWHQGEDIGERLGRIVDTQSYVLVDIYGYDHNPVKLFRHDVEVIDKPIEQATSELFDEYSDDDIDSLFSSLKLP